MSPFSSRGIEGYCCIGCGWSFDAPLTILLVAGGITSLVTGMIDSRMEWESRRYEYQASQFAKIRWFLELLFMVYLVLVSPL